MPTSTSSLQPAPLLLTAAAAFVGGAVVARALPLGGSGTGSSYKPGKVWKFLPQGGTWGSVNRPSAGPRTKAALPRGEHDVQLYSLGTPNGMKVTCLLEELHARYGLEYDAWMIGIGGDDLDQFKTGFVEVNPNSKIPGLLHYASDGTKKDITTPPPPTRVFESAAIMMYLCEQYDTEGAFLPKQGDPRRAECLSWLFWAQGSAPFLGGGFGHFYHYAPVKIKYAIDRYSMETKRQLDVLERHLSGAVAEDLGEGRGPYAGGPYLCGDRITVADVCVYPWYGRFVEGKLYGDGAEYLSTHEYPHVLAWARRMGERDGVKRGCMVNRSSGDEGLPVLRERHSSSDFEGLSR